MRDQIDAVIDVTGENYEYIRYMWSTHVGIGLKPVPATPQVILTRNGSTELYAGIFKGGLIGDARYRPHDLGRLLQGDTTPEPYPELGSTS